MNSDNGLKDIKVERREVFVFRLNAENGQNGQNGQCAYYGRVNVPNVNVEKLHQAII